MLKLGRDYWFLVSAYNWNHFCSARLRLCVLWLNGKLKIIKSDDSVHQQRLRTRCTKYFQICWDATKLQRAASSTRQKKNNQSARKTVNLVRTKVRFLRVKVNKWMVEVERCALHLYPCDQIESFPLSGFCPFLQFGPNRIFWYRATHPEWDLNFLRLWMIFRNL